MDSLNIFMKQLMIAICVGVAIIIVTYILVV